jgi:dethiobiotin synthetase
VPAAFITSTGTEIGKTFVTAGLIRHFRAQGRAVSALKPVVSGFDPNATEESDPGRLLAALGKPVTLEEIATISPWRFAAPVSPDIAASHDGTAIPFSEVVEFSRRAMAVNATRFVEGVGGVMVPLDDRHTVLDWMTALRFPAIVVAGSYLGTISHTLTALHMIAARKIATCAVVVSETLGSPVSLDETVASIARFVDIDVIALPRLPPATETHPAFERLARLV